ncbi:MFS transporter [Oxalobacter sp. OxGP1]|uniref:MFS transporter n=1 Tax=Oxalobacter paeniformigenes TaxID=2946594 RepID=UPI0022AE8E56|nr:MFS transporter [Oxalobacter paeniformigenes]MCZ4052442.1 MFS transporter [Oxalobacter paeniformigenes]
MKKSLVALAAGTFALGIAEFVMMGMLPDVATDLGVSIPAAGHFIAAYALGVCAGAPLLVLIARTRPLKQILLGLAALIALGNLCTAFAPEYWSMLATRFISGLPHGAFFGVGSIVADKLSDRDKVAQAIAIMTAGMTLANVLGVPAGTWISHNVSWRITFAGVGLWALVLFWLIRRWIPYLAPLPDTGILGQFRFFRHLPPWLILFATALGNGGAFCWFSYVNPLLTRVSGIAPSDMTAVMVLAGMGMLVGNLAGGRLSDRFGPGKIAFMAQGVMCCALFATFFLAPHPVCALMLMTVCTTCLFTVSAPQQLLLIRHAKGGEMLGAASVQIAFNLGNALGAWLGGLPVSAGYRYEYTTLPASALALTGCLLLLLFWLRFEAPARTVRTAA